MAGRVYVKLDGLKELREGLDEFSRTIQRNIARRALIRPAQLIGDDAQARAPVSSDPRDPTPGSLKASMQVVRATGRNNQALARVSILFIDPAAVANEYGTTKMAAQPFLRPAVDAKTAEATVLFGSELAREVEKAAAKAAAKSAKFAP